MATEQDVQRIMNMASEIGGRRFQNATTMAELQKVKAQIRELVAEKDRLYHEKSYKRADQVQKKIEQLMDQEKKLQSSMSDSDDILK